MSCFACFRPKKPNAGKDAEKQSAPAQVLNPLASSLQSASHTTTNGDSENPKQLQHVETPNPLADIQSIKSIGPSGPLPREPWEAPQAATPFPHLQYPDSLGMLAADPPKPTPPSQANQNHNYHVGTDFPPNYRTNGKRGASPRVNDSLNQSTILEEDSEDSETFSILSAALSHGPRGGSVPPSPPHMHHAFNHPGLEHDVQYQPPTADQLPNYDNLFVERKSPGSVRSMSSLGSSASLGPTRRYLPFPGAAPLPPQPSWGPSQRSSRAGSEVNFEVQPPEEPPLAQNGGTPYRNGGERMDAEAFTYGGDQGRDFSAATSNPLLSSINVDNVADVILSHPPDDDDEFASVNGSFDSRLSDASGRSSWKTKGGLSASTPSTPTATIPEDLDVYHIPSPPHLTPLLTSTAAQPSDAGGESPTGRQATAPPGNGTAESPLAHELPSPPALQPHQAAPAGPHTHPAAFGGRESPTASTVYHDPDEEPASPDRGPSGERAMMPHAAPLPSHGPPPHHMSAQLHHSHSGPAAAGAPFPHAGPPHAPPHAPAPHYSVHNYQTNVHVNALPPHFTPPQFHAPAPPPPHYQHSRTMPIPRRGQNPYTGSYTGTPHTGSYASSPYTGSPQHQSPVHAANPMHSSSPGPALHMPYGSAPHRLHGARPPYGPPSQFPEARGHGPVNRGLDFSQGNTSLNSSYNSALDYSQALAGPGHYSHSPYGSPAALNSFPAWDRRHDPPPRGAGFNPRGGAGAGEALTEREEINRQLQQELDHDQRELEEQRQSYHRQILRSYDPKQAQAYRDPRDQYYVDRYGQARRRSRPTTPQGEDEHGHLRPPRIKPGRKGSGKAVAVPPMLPEMDEREAGDTEDSQLKTFDFPSQDELDRARHTQYAQYKHERRGRSGRSSRSGSMRGVDTGARRYPSAYSSGTSRLAGSDLDESRAESMHAYGGYAERGSEEERYDFQAAPRDRKLSNESITGILQSRLGANDSLNGSMNQSAISIPRSDAGRKSVQWTDMDGNGSLVQEQPPKLSNHAPVNKRLTSAMAQHNQNSISDLSISHIDELEVAPILNAEDHGVTANTPSSLSRLGS